MKSNENIEEMLNRIKKELTQFNDDTNASTGTDHEFDDIRKEARNKTQDINTKAQLQDYWDDTLCSIVQQHNLEESLGGMLRTSLYHLNEERREAAVNNLNNDMRRVTHNYFNRREDFLMDVSPEQYRLKLLEVANSRLKENGLDNPGITAACVEVAMNTFYQITREANGKLEINSEALRKLQAEQPSLAKAVSDHAKALEKRLVSGERTAMTTQGILKDHIKTAERWWKANEVERQQQQFRQNAMETFRFFSSFGEMSHSRTLSQIGALGTATVQVFDGLARLSSLPATLQGLNNLGNLANGLNALSGLANGAQGLFAIAGPIGSIASALIPIMGMLRKNKQQGPNPFSEILKHQSFMFSQIMNGLMMIDHRLIEIHSDIHKIQNMLCEIMSRQISEFFDVKTLLVLGLDMVQNKISKMHSDLKRHAEAMIFDPLERVLFRLENVDNGNNITDRKEYAEFIENLLFWLVKKGTTDLLNGRALSIQENFQRDFPAHEVNTALAFCASQDLEFASSNRHIGNLIGYLAEFAKRLFTNQELSNNPDLLNLLNNNFVNPLIWLRIIDQYDPLVRNIAINHPEWLGKERMAMVIKNGEDVVRFIKTSRTNEHILPRLLENYDRAFTEICECIDVLVQEADKKLNEHNTHVSKLSILGDLAVQLNEFRDLRPLEQLAEYGQERLKVDVFYQKLSARGFSIPPELLLLERLGGQKISLHFTDYARFLDGRVEMAFICSIKVQYNNTVLIGNKYVTGRIPKSEAYTFPGLWVGNYFSNHEDIPEETKAVAEVRIAALNEINERIRKIRRDLLNKLLEPGSAYYNSKFKPALEKLESAYLMLRAFLILGGYRLDENVMNHYWGKNKILNLLNNSIWPAPDQLPAFVTQLKAVSENSLKVRKEMLENIFSGEGLEAHTLEIILELRLASLRQLERATNPNSSAETKRNSEVMKTNYRSLDRALTSQYAKFTELSKQPKQHEMSLESISLGSVSGGGTSRQHSRLSSNSWTPAKDMAADQKDDVTEINSGKTSTQASKSTKRKDKI